jgi:glycosyltransferase involved in cell wall biosynthesis
MRIALAHDHLNQFGGAEQVLKVLSDMYPDAPIYTLLHDPQAIDSMFAPERIRSSYLARLPGARFFFRWMLPLMPSAVESLAIPDVDVILSSASALMKGIVIHPGVLHVCYCHTPTRYLWSDAHAYLEELRYPRALKKFLPLFLSRLRMWDWHAAQRVHRFVANSRFIAERIRTYYHREATVIYPPVDVAAFDHIVSGDRGKYFLLISRLRPYKRIDLAITAFAKMNIPLVIIGTGAEEIHLKLKARAEGKNITFLGRVSEQEKCRWLGRARALIHPQEEDFGITAVEAMAAGTPVICYGAGGARETVIPGVTGVYFDEQTWEALADAVIRFDDAAFDSGRIRAHADQFSRERFEREMREYVNNAWEEFVAGKRRV